MRRSTANSVYLGDTNLSAISVHHMSHVGTPTPSVTSALQMYAPPHAPVAVRSTARPDATRGLCTHLQTHTPVHPQLYQTHKGDHDRLEATLYRCNPFAWATTLDGYKSIYNTVREVSRRPSCAHLTRPTVHLKRDGHMDRIMVIGDYCVRATPPAALAPARRPNSTARPAGP